MAKLGYFERTQVNGVIRDSVRQGGAYFVHQPPSDDRPKMLSAHRSIHCAALNRGTHDIVERAVWFARNHLYVLVGPELFRRTVKWCQTRECKEAANA